jgi:hypothetical protein
MEQYSKIQVYTPYGYAELPWQPESNQNTPQTSEKRGAEANWGLEPSGMYEVQFVWGAQGFLDVAAGEKGRESEEDHRTADQAAG